MERTAADSTTMDNGAAYGSYENAAALFQPDALLSAQFSATAQRKTAFEAEKRLMFAILNDAIACYQENVFSQRKKNRRLFDEAEAWIVSPGGDGIFSFDIVCESLGFNPEYMRLGLMRWKETCRRMASPSVATDAKKIASRLSAGNRASERDTKRAETRRYKNEFVGIDFSR